MHKPDPEDLRISEQPAVVDIEDQGAVFVADAAIRDSGWVRLREWDGSHVKVPPHRVRAIRMLDTERYGEVDASGQKPKRIADDDWLEQAKDDPEPEVVPA